MDFPCVQLHHTHPSDKLISDLVRMYPKEVAIVLLGPATAFARALDRDPELCGLVERVMMVGGAWREAGDVTAAAEFHVYCDPAAARQVFRCGVPLTLLPLDVTRKVVFSPTELLHLPNPESPASRFLGQIVPHAISGFRRSLRRRGMLSCRTCSDWWRWCSRRLSRRDPSPVDVETRGELTRGATVCDVRWGTTAKANVELAVDVDVSAVRQFIRRTLSRE